MQEWLPEVDLTWMDDRCTGQGKGIEHHMVRAFGELKSTVGVANQMTPSKVEHPIVSG
jgi:hypothetical protein